MDKRLQKVINYFHENMVANPPGGSGGFTASSNPSGPTAGYDPVIGRIDRRQKRNRNYPKELVTFYNRLVEHKGDVYKATKNGQ